MRYARVCALHFTAITMLPMFVLGVVKRNPLFLHEIERKNNGFLFTTPNMI